MSNYLTENGLSPTEAMNKGLAAGASHIVIETNNGAIEVHHGDGSLLMQTKNVRKGTMNKIWELLEDCGDIDFRA